MKSFKELYYSKILVEGVQADDIIVDLRSLLVETSTDGHTPKWIQSEVDDDFLNHSDHAHRLIHGGKHADGTTYPDGGGLRWGGLEVDGGEAQLKVMGSYEWKDQQSIYHQIIKFSNFKEIMSEDGLNWIDKARKLVKDRVRVHCDCPCYKYFYAYAATKKGFALKPETRPSNKTNPHLEGGICKHLDLVLQYLPAQYTRIASELKKIGSK